MSTSYIPIVINCDTDVVALQVGVMSFSVIIIAVYKPPSIAILATCL